MPQVSGTGGGQVGQPASAPKGVDLHKVPEPVRQSVAEIIEPAHRQMVAQAEDPLERSIVLTMVHLMWKTQSEPFRSSRRGCVRYTGKRVFSALPRSTVREKSTMNKVLKHSIHRRDVLKRLAAIGCAAPVFVPGSVLGAEGKAAASERIAVGHVGVGNRGSSLFREVQQVPDFQSVATADCYKNRREGVANICKGTAYADFRDLLAREDIDAVYIATPDHWHVPIGILAAKAGKDVYIEKPLGVTLQEDLAIEKVLEETGRIFQYGTQQRSMGHCWAGCELVRRGAIGKVHTIEVDAPNGGAGGSTAKAPVPDGFDFEMWCGPAPMRDYTTDLCKTPGTYWVYDYSIGYLGGWGAHPLDIMVWGSDADVSGPVTVEGTGVVPAEGLYDTVKDWDMKIKLGKVDLIFRPGGDRTKFIGSDGWIQVARAAGRNAASDPAFLPTQPAEPLSPRDDSLQVSRSHSGNFAEAIKTRKPPVSNIRDAVRSDVISLLCDIAVRTGEKITWDPARKELVGPSSEAQAMFSRKMRAPWTL